MEADEGSERMIEIAGYVRQGANAYLGVLVPVAVLGLVLPNYTVSTPAGLKTPTGTVSASTTGATTAVSAMIVFSG